MIDNENSEAYAAFLEVFKDIDKKIMFDEKIKKMTEEQKDEFLNDFWFFNTNQYKNIKTINDLLSLRYVLFNKGHADSYIILGVVQAILTERGKI